jgi:hypothetical protein
MSQLNVGGDQFVNVDGAMVEKDALLIAERLAEYDPNLHVICLDPMKAEINDAPFIIAELCADGQMRRIFECWELNNSVLDRIMAADTSKFDILSDMDKINERAKKNMKTRYEEQHLENLDISKHILESKKSSYTAPNSRGETTRFHYDRPARSVEREREAKSNVINV